VGDAARSESVLSAQAVYGIAARHGLIPRPRRAGAAGSRSLTIGTSRCSQGGQGRCEGAVTSQASYTKPCAALAGRTARWHRYVYREVGFGMNIAACAKRVPAPIVACGGRK
jgi:hypothetical protein